MLGVQSTRCDNFYGHCFHKPVIALNRHNPLLPLKWRGGGGGEEEEEKKVKVSASFMGDKKSSASFISFHPSKLHILTPPHLPTAASPPPPHPTPLIL